MSDDRFVTQCAVQQCSALQVDMTTGATPLLTVCCCPPDDEDEDEEKY